MKITPISVHSSIRPAGPRHSQSVGTRSISSKTVDTDRFSKYSRTLKNETLNASEENTVLKSQNRSWRHWPRWSRFRPLWCGIRNGFGGTICVTSGSSRYATGSNYIKRITTVKTRTQLTVERITNGVGGQEHQFCRLLQMCGCQCERKSGRNPLLEPPICITQHDPSGGHAPLPHTQTHCWRFCLLWQKQKEEWQPYV